MTQKVIPGFRFAEVQRDDTLQKIAARELGGAARWPELVSFNSLRPPFIAEVAGPGVLAFGDYLKVPASTTQVDAETSPDEVFGRDVALTDGQIDVIDGDFVVAGGRDNLRQALRHRMDTDAGELMYHPGYGSEVRRILGTITGPTASLLAAQYARSAILADARVSDVTQAVAKASGDTIAVSIEAVPVTGKAVDASATF